MLKMAKGKAEKAREAKAVEAKAAKVEKEKVAAVPVLQSVTSVKLLVGQASLIKAPTPFAQISMSLIPVRTITGLISLVRTEELNLERHS